MAVVYTVYAQPDLKLTEAGSLATWNPFHAKRIMAKGSLMPLVKAFEKRCKEIQGERHGLVAKWTDKSDALIWALNHRYNPAVRAWTVRPAQVDAKASTARTVADDSGQEREAA